MSDGILSQPIVDEYCRYRDELISEPVGGATKPRYRIYDPENDIAYELGHMELMLATMFNGERSHDEIKQLARERLSVSVSLEKLDHFQNRLLRLGLLAHNGERGGLGRDPATGITYGPLKRYLLINLIKMNPQRGLDSLYRRASWLCAPWLNAVLLLLVVAAFSYLFSHWASFRQDVLETYIHSWSWLAWHYPVILSSIAIHELGHALSCRHYRVKVTDFGIGVYTLYG